MRFLNAFLSQIGYVLISPFASHPLLGLLFWGTVSGVATAWVFGKTSNQRRLQELVDETRAHLLAIKLFKHDLLVTFECQWKLLKATGLRLWHSLPPTLVMLVPFCLVLIQLAQWYEFVPLTPGEATVVQLDVASDRWDRCQDTRLEAPGGVTVATDSLRDAASAQLAWRVQPEEGRPAVLQWNFGSEVVEKRLSVAQTAGPLMPVAVRRPTAAWWDQALHPLEPPCTTDGPVRAISLQHARRQTLVGSWNVPWWATFVLVSMIAAWIFRRPLGVTF